ncbi:Hpt domain-containing protein [Roseateles sp. BYS180W]|uniref:Hpt domain-containing protein n=1 Tax=Roseateles rivi TaxID=3299028 RepID=A0ABW7FV01_9BURK
MQKLRDLDPEGQHGLLARLAQAFEQSLERYVPVLHQPRHSEQDYEALRLVAHTLKSSASSLGAVALSRLCARIELLAHQREEAELPALLNNALTQIEEVRQALRDLVSN